MDKIINNSIKDFYRIINKKLLIKEELLENRYIINIVNKCEKKECNNNIINNKTLCYIHLNEYKKEENDNNININKNIKNNELKYLGDNIYEDIFGLKYIKIEENIKLI